MPRRRAAVDPNLLEMSTLNKEATLGDLKNLIAEVFMDAQKPDALLRVDAIKLRDIQLACCLNAPRMVGQAEDIDYDGETRFLKLVFKMVDCVIRAKKREPAADRVQRFIAGFMQYIYSKDEEAIKKAKEKKEALLNNSEPNETSNVNELTNEPTDEPMEDVVDEIDQQEENNTEEGSREASAPDREDTPEDQTSIDQEAILNFNEDYETITSRFVESFLKHLFQGFQDSKSSVRFRCCQLLALSLSSMGELDEDLYQELRTHLLEVYLDKEPSVRAQACTALCRLQGDPEVDPSDNRTILEKLMWSVRHDPSPEVRRLILFNIEVTVDALPFIVKCVRDPDHVNRKVIYLKSLSNIDDFRMLTFDQRYEVLKWGLNDRNELVQKVAYKMFAEKWIVQANSNLLEFLERLGAATPTMAPLVEKLLKLFFKDRKDIVNDINFDEDYWLNANGESALLAKVVIQHLQSTDESDERLDSIIPEVTRHVFTLESCLNVYQAKLEASDKDGISSYEFIITQLLEMSLSLDYADEVGRRKMFEFLRTALKSYRLADVHLKKVLELFRTISIDERDFTRSIIEIISDIQEEITDPFADMEDELPAKKARTSNGGRRSSGSTELLDSQSSQSVREQTPSTEGLPTPSVEDDTAKDTEKAEKQFHCLKICKLTLELSFEPFTENSNLYGLLNDLIVPAVHSSDVQLREEGLHCLALCCMLDKGLAQHNIGLFITCIQHGHEDLVPIAIRSISDILLMYGMEAMNDYISSPELVREVYEFGLDHDDTKIQSITAEGLCKLMLFNRYGDNELLRLLVLLYFFPKSITDESSNNIHQCLAYFFPAYCYSSVNHQKALANITLPALEELCNVYNDLDKDETMTSPKQISDILADWNDPRKLVMKTTKVPTFVDDEEEIDYETQGTLAIETLHIIYNEEDGLKRRTACHFLLRLYLDKICKEQMLEIKKLIDSVNEERPIKLLPVRKALIKISDNFEKILESQDDVDVEENENRETSENQEQEMEEVVEEENQSKEPEIEGDIDEEVQSNDQEIEEDIDEEAQSNDQEIEGDTDEELKLNDQEIEEAADVETFNEQLDDVDNEEAQSISDYEDADDEAGAVDYSDRPAEVYVRIDGIVNESILSLSESDAEASSDD